MKTPIQVFLFLFLILPSVTYAQSNPSVRSMSLADIEDERNGIRLHQQYVNYMIQTGEKIRDGVCNSYWRGALRAKQELSEIPAGYRNFSYRHKRAAKEKENKDYLDQYERCFSKALRSFPDIYNNSLEPARSYAEFDRVYLKLSGELNKNQARFFELGQELKARQGR